MTRMIRIKYFFAASVLIELVAFGLWLWGDQQEAKGVVWIVASMFSLQVSLLYESGFRLFKKDKV